ncbi:toll/interleukin-1 receptor domain-containing protein [Paludibaculum fermentans]|uniref:Toll/interleukin-1 receptor domain-containing protein n=1 Tax=Paludibaculum fermentans TaxID=1473598 RepID=A0A7S7SM47_PALFE|nr:toll/interleukin-1 receptor domain-containing protein [Paludibaculum fermentans]QOY90069.1 toll/interleukin-1 receptor domain-containing protein [Paludibaculum fermentans]
MAESDKSKTADAELLQVSGSTPLVFISHDARDAELAEAFSKLLKSVSAGMIKTFRSSDKKGTEGIDFGEEWYKRLMTQLQSTSDVVCLFTERSLDRPWILFEAGVAKGKLSTPVLGVALGVPLARVSAGPFYQFMNMDDSEADLTKLVNQLARRVPNLELDTDVVTSQVANFKATEAAILKKLSSGNAKSEAQVDVDESAVAKLAEEMKALPSRVAERLAEVGDPFRRRRLRRFHPMMFEELMHMSGEPGDPVAILMAASVVREDVPWLYELAMEAYRAVKAEDTEAVEREMKRLRRFADVMAHGPFMEELGFGSKETHMLAMEFPRVLEHMLMRTLEMRKSQRPLRRRSQKARMETESGK